MEVFDFAGRTKLAFESPDKYCACCMLIICAAIGGNEEDIRNTDLSYRLKKLTYVFVYIVFKLQRIFLFLQSDVLLRWSLEQNVVF